MPIVQVWRNWGDAGLKCKYESFEKRVNLQAQEYIYIGEFGIRCWFIRQNFSCMTMNLQDYKIVIKIIEIIERSIQIRKY